MASYIDTVPTFHPYVQQLPVEAMTSVGLEKQRRYDEGYQRIQSTIDKVAGLSVMRDVDKNYLHSKMNELGNNLRMVSMGDFSNYQLVNSVGGMVNQVGNDGKIQNAVISTANIQTQQKAINDAKTKGEWGPENEYEYNKKLSGYMQSTTPGDLFTDKYTPYIDVNKKITAIAKEVGIDERTMQSMYSTDMNGNPLTYKQDTTDSLGKHKAGDIQWNPVMVEKHLKGKDAGKILDAFQNALTPADYNQLGITGRYVRANSTPEQLQNEIITNYGNNISSVNGEIDELKMSIASEEGSNAKDPEKLASLNKQLEIFQNNKIRLQKAQQSDLATLAINPDAVRANLYTNSYLTGMARDLASMTKDTKYSVSPQFEVTMKINEFNRSVQRDKIADQHWAIEQKRADEKFKYEKEKDQLEFGLKYGKKFGPNGELIDNGIPAPVDTKGGAAAIAASVKDNFVNEVAQLNSTNYKIAVEYFKKAYPKESDIQIHKRITDYAESKGKPFTAGSEDVNEAVADLASKQLDEWKKDPEKVPFDLRGLIKSQYERTRNLSIDKEQMAQIKQEAYKKAANDGQSVVTEQEIQNNIHPTTIQLKGYVGTGSLFGSREIVTDEVNLSREDIVNLANLYPARFNTFGPISTDEQQTKASKSAKNRLLTKYGPQKLARIVTEVYGSPVSVEDIQSDGISYPHMSESPVYSPMNNEVLTAGKFIHSSNYQKLAEIESQLYLEKGFVKQPVRYSVLRGKENEDDINSKIVDIISNYPMGNETSGFNAEDMKAIVLSGKKNAVTTLVTPELDGSVSYTMTIDGTGGKSKTMKINEAEWSFITGETPRSNSPEPRVLKQINLYGTSGHNGSNDENAAWFPSDEFTNLKGTNYSAVGNLIPDKDNSNLLWLTMYVTDKRTGETHLLTYDAPIPKIVDGKFNQTLDNLPRAINPTVIEGLKKQQSQITN